MPVSNTKRLSAACSMNLRLRVIPIMTLILPMFMFLQVTMTTLPMPRRHPHERTHYDAMHPQATRNTWYDRSQTQGPDVDGNTDDMRKPSAETKPMMLFSMFMFLQVAMTTLTTLSQHSHEWSRYRMRSLQPTRDTWSDSTHTQGRDGAAFADPMGNPGTGKKIYSHLVMLMFLPIWDMSIYNVIHVDDNKSYANSCSMTAYDMSDDVEIIYYATYGDYCKYYANSYTMTVYEMSDNGETNSIATIDVSLAVNSPITCAADDNYTDHTMTRPRTIVKYYEMYIAGYNTCGDLRSCENRQICVIPMYVLIHSDTNAHALYFKAYHMHAGTKERYYPWDMREKADIRLPNDDIYQRCGEQLTRSVRHPNGMDLITSRSPRGDTYPSSQFSGACDGRCKGLCHTLAKTYCENVYWSMMNGWFRYQPNSGICGEIERNRCTALSKKCSRAPLSQPNITWYKVLNMMSFAHEHMCNEQIWNVYVLGRVNRKYCKTNKTKLMDVENSRCSAPNATHNSPESTVPCMYNKQHCIIDNLLLFYCLFLEDSLKDHGEEPRRPTSATRAIRSGKRMYGTIHQSVSVIISQDLTYIYLFRTTCESTGAMDIRPSLESDEFPNSCVCKHITMNCVNSRVTVIMQSTNRLIYIYDPDSACVNDNPEWRIPGCSRSIGVIMLMYGENVELANPCECKYITMKYDNARVIVILQFTNRLIPTYDPDVARGNDNPIRCNLGCMRPIGFIRFTYGETNEAQCIIYDYKYDIYNMWNSGTPTCNTRQHHSMTKSNEPEDLVHVKKFTNNERDTSITYYRYHICVYECSVCI